jgi:hypothetical protein
MLHLTGSTLGTKVVIISFAECLSEVQLVPVNVTLMVGTTSHCKPCSNQSTVHYQLSLHLSFQIEGCFTFFLVIDNVAK